LSRLPNASGAHVAGLTRHKDPDHNTEKSTLKITQLDRVFGAGLWALNYVNIDVYKIICIFSF